MALARRRLLTVLIVVVAALLLARMFLVGRYYVNGPSMEPTIRGAARGGDHLLVRYGGARDLKRFDLVALLVEGSSEPVVKRVGGLGGEKVELHNGDLWIDDALLPPDTPRPAPVLIFDEEHVELESWFNVGDTWKRGAEGWELDAPEVEPGAGTEPMFIKTGAGLMFMKKGLKDHYLGPDGEVVEGRDTVNDCIVECEVKMGDPPATLRLGLVEMGDTFDAVIEDLGGARAAVRLIRRSSIRSRDREGEAPAPSREVLAEGEIPLGEGFHHLRFSNVDDHLSLEVDGIGALSHGYSGNSFRADDGARIGSSQPTERVYLGGSEGRAVFRKIRVLRDLHYTPRGEYGVQEPIQLGPAEIFVLGDNSRESRDSRDWGPISLNQVFGRPIWVVWPPSRVRSLDSPADR